MDMATPALAFGNALAWAFLPINDAKTQTQLTLAQLTQEQIEVRAYQLWQERGCPDGSPEIDWLAAEAELMVNDLRTRRKLRAIEYKGGCCQMCGYKTNSAALQFHHHDGKK